MITLQYMINVIFFIDFPVSNNNIGCQKKLGRVGDLYRSVGHSVLGRSGNTAIAQPSGQFNPCLDAAHKMGHKCFIFISPV